MSQDQFLAIPTMLHQSNNETHISRGQIDYDSLYKVKPILNLIIEFLNIIHHTFFYLKTFPRLGSVKAYAVGMMNNVQKLNNCIHIHTINTNF
jgi:hypothetical protein